MQQRIGPENPGLSRFLAARTGLVLMAGFYVAGLVFVFLFALGIDPLASHVHVSLPSMDWFSLT